MSIALAVILIIMALAYGVLIGWIVGVTTGTRRGVEYEPTSTIREERELSEAELERIEAERRQLIEDNKAFQAMLDYNASMAYGMAKGDERER